MPAGLELYAGARGLFPSTLLLSRFHLQEAFSEMLFSTPPISFLPLFPQPPPFLGLAPGPPGHPGVQRERKENFASLMFVIFPWGDENIQHSHSQDLLLPGLGLM